MEFSGNTGILAIMTSESHRFARRLNGMFIFFAVWSIAVMLRVFWIAGPGRDHFIAAGEKIARIEGELPALRGRILDRNGVPLAWSERYYDLVSTLADDSVAVPEARTALREVLPRLPVDAAPPVWFRGLSPSELLALEAVVRSGAVPVTIRLREERIAVNSPVLRDRLGSCESRHGVLVGVSGLELAYNRELAGRSGRFAVMLDRWRRWIPASWKLLRPAVPGGDVTVDFEVGEAEVRP